MDIDVGSTRFRLQPLIPEVELGGSSISSLAAYNSNVYIGTSTGLILHYHKFEDAPDHILISQLDIGPDRVPITKIFVLPSIERLLILCGDTLYTYCVPELSPSRIKKIKDVVDLLILVVLNSASEPTAAPNEKLIVFSSSKIRLLQFSANLIKLLKDIAYTGATKGISCSSGASSNYGNLALVANKSNYEIVDLQQTRKIPLFDYKNDDSNTTPYLLPFKDGQSTEHLLTVKSDNLTSIAMFINSLGDVTRGTISWIDMGYPENGLVISWPYAIGIFKKEESYSIIVSSLESLDVQKTVPLDSPLAITHIDSELHYESSRLKSILEGNESSDVSRTTSLLVHDDKTVFYFYEEEGFIILYDKIIAVLDNETPTLTDLGPLVVPLEELLGSLEGSVHDFILQARLLLLLATQNYESLQEIISKTHPDPRLFLTFHKESEVPTFKGILRIIGLLKPHIEVPGSFLHFVVLASYKQKENLEPAIIPMVRTLYYELEVKDSQDLVYLVNQDKEFWLGIDITSEPIIDFLKTNKHFLGLLYIYLYRQKNACTTPLSVEVCELALKLLRSEVEDQYYPVQNGTLKTATETLDLPNLIFQQLAKDFDDVDTYTKYLLEMLKLFPQEGIEYLKTHKKGKNSHTHSNILKQVSKSGESETDFSALKLEYMEAQFIEELDFDDLKETLLDELIEEQGKMLNSQVNESNKINFNILADTYRLEHPLHDPHWPRITWVEYLHIHGKRSECSDFIKNYIKFYELLLIKRIFSPNDVAKFDVQDSTLSYVSLLVRSDNPVDFLFEFGDYSSAEFYILHGVLPFPKVSDYFDDHKDSITRFYSMRKKDDIKHDLKRLFDRYMSVDDDEGKFHAAKHFLIDYGSEYFTTSEILQLVPEYTPMVYLQDYLMARLIESTTERRSSVLRKVLSRTDAKTNQRLCKDFEVK